MFRGPRRAERLVIDIVMELVDGGNLSTYVWETENGLCELSQLNGIFPLIVLDSGGDDPTHRVPAMQSHGSE